MRWRGLLATATNRGSSPPLFERLVFGPLVHLDLHGDDPPAELLERTLDEVLRLTKQQIPS